MKEGKCLPPGPSFTGYAMVTIVSDVAVALIPVPVLLGLNIPLEKKLGLIMIFALGLFTTICSIMRYLQINRIQNGDGNSTMLVLWGTIEFNVGVSCSIQRPLRGSKERLTRTSDRISSLLCRSWLLCLCEKRKPIDQRALGVKTSREMDPEARVVAKGARPRNTTHSTTSMLRAVRSKVIRRRFR